MSLGKNPLVNAAIISAYALILDHNIYDDKHKRHEFRKQTILADESLKENEKSEAVNILNKMYDRSKILTNEGTKRICENCNQECLATTYCENCIRNYLKANFSNWTSGNDIIDNLLQECQMKIIAQDLISEWIPYNNLQNIKYLTRGGFSEIYTADWIDGKFFDWDSEGQQLKRIGSLYVVLKRLGNIENANQSWIEEAKLHLDICNKWGEIVRCYGLTQDPLNGDYMLVMPHMDVDLRKYLQQNHKQLTWKERIQIIADIALALERIHDENAIHRDLHSGNILFKAKFFISDLGFCGPADKPLKSIYGNLPYIAPEVIIGKEQTYKSDIYSIAMLMWEISSGQPPFINYEHNYDLAMNIVNGIRPKIVLGTPLEYEHLMKQCWDVDPSKRLEIHTLWDKMSEINLFYQSQSNDQLDSLEINNSSSLVNYAISTSKLHQFDNLPEPRNATEEELEAFHSKLHDFNIPNKIEDFDKLNNQKNSKSKISSIIKDIQNDYKGEIMQLKVKKNDNNFDDENEMYNNPNLHSEEQNELELPENIQSNYKTETMQKQEEKHHTNVDDDDGIYNNPNIHSEEQNELELPGNIQSNYKIETIMQKQEEKHYTNVDDDDKIHNNPNIHSEEQNELELPEIIQSNYKIETMQKQEEKHYTNVDVYLKNYYDYFNDDKIHNNPNIHSEEQNELELPEIIQSNYKIETMQKQEEKHYTNVDDDDEIYNNPNLHSEEQNELELPENVQSNYKIETMQKQEEKHYTNIDGDNELNIHSEKQNESKLPKRKSSKKHVLKLLRRFKTCFACFKRCFKPFNSK
ncbi:Cla4p [Rhizophagus irregularis DAOM 197198w]|uniref:Cla4p n=2 Tax=Rhizophagus irregularis TaxID=588596 RepID=A0A015JH38_RHIIW|nr:Cla4p [Rhizophagus irregularis DAOM 197198w]